MGGKEPRHSKNEPSQKAVYLNTSVVHFWGVHPFRAPEPLPILNPSNFVPKNGFPGVKVKSLVIPKNETSQKAVYLNTYVVHFWGVKEPRHSKNETRQKAVYTLVPTSTSYIFGGLRSLVNQKTKLAKNRYTLIPMSYIECVRKKIRSFVKPMTTNGQFGRTSIKLIHQVYYRTRFPSGMWLREWRKRRSNEHLTNTISWRFALNRGAGVSCSAE